ncbi:carbohydrate ABC transporter permease [Paenibacillus prosopidis]|uniref:Multiple sugar transport system permease protein n=1 Tax=Paenibacillus prosopidis TaxID=630520 RepID=A0A368W547_9BACL|nr:sugar ABC transporter permease [Paenibacillus prosopidis]RCW49551.1 multiple sugar transport system permease protein [Paenibacillus prosopidis]
MLQTKKWRQYATFYAFVSPWLIIFIFLGLFPLLYGLYLSFTNFTGFNMNQLKFVGFSNYKTVFLDSESMYALGRTLLVTAINVPISLAIGLFLAVLLNLKIKGLSWWRTAFYIPSVVPVVSTVLMWKFIFSGDGLLNTLFDKLQLQPINWLGYEYATTALIVMLLWGAGGSLLINLAGLKGIPADLYEAAEIDGASPVRKFFTVTLPLMTHILFFNLIMGIIGSLQIYIQPILLSGKTLLDSPIKPNYLYLVHAFQQIFAFQRFGYGLALMWVLFIAILLLTVLVFYSSRFWVYYETDQEV